MKDWLAELQKLPLSKIAVAHEPMTARYARAIDKRAYVIREGNYLGSRAIDFSNAIEVAIFAENPEGRKKSGFYSCFRIFHDSDQTPLLALLFCFYDGTESSPTIKSLEAAQAFAREGGFQ
ncbi:MAG: hypothetical protein M3Q07_11635 [Pseudobdellovibrionaceae bacterium]|nr:hypothetical protein [Pseudobdellovibrionaceae bacterium]